MWQTCESAHVANMRIGACGKHANRQLYHVKVQHITKAAITADWQAFTRPTAL